jgi:N utilization substance protein A
VNIKLASELTGYSIDVYRDDEEQVEQFDFDLDEFVDEIDQWIIDEFKRVGCDTAQSVLKLSDNELERRTDLEKETIADVRRILQTEMDNQKEE